jgi:hypothetical protein
MAGWTSVQADETGRSSAAVPPPSSLGR